MTGEALTKPKRISAKSGVHIRKLITEAVGILLSMVILVPFLVILVNSMKDYKGASDLGLSLAGASFAQAFQNYVSVFQQAKLLNSLLNSLIVTTISVICIVSFSSLAAYTVMRRKTKAMHTLNMIIIAGLTLPMAMVPSYYLLSRLHLSSGTGSYLGAILVYTAGNFAFAYFMYTGYIKGVSSEIDEAAIIDGASPFGLFFRIIFPLLKPVTVTVVINEVMTVWNDFSVALYLLNNSKRSTAVLTTYLFTGQKSSYWNLLFADVILVSLPIIILYMVLQKYIVAGLTAGAVKG